MVDPFIFRICVYRAYLRQLSDQLLINLLILLFCSGTLYILDSPRDIVGNMGMNVPYKKKEIEVILSTTWDDSKSASPQMRFGKHTFRNIWTKSRLDNWMVGKKRS